MAIKLSSKSFHERLKLMMSDLNIAPVMLAERTGIDLTNISHLLHGDRSPSLMTLNKILLALPANIDTRWLITGSRK